MPSASLSSSVPDEEPVAAPELLHSLVHSSSVLALAASATNSSIYAGTQDGEIVVWSLGTFSEIRRVQAHKRSVLCLFLDHDANLLFSSAGDPVINVWCAKTLKRLYEIYSTHDVGDIFSVAYSAQADTVYVGAQNTTIQWARLGDAKLRVGWESARHPDRRSHRFFDSKAVGGVSTPRRNEDRWTLIPKAEAVVEMDSLAIMDFAHYGYVYCMLMAKGPTVLVDSDEEVLISGGGDGTIKLWRLRPRPEDATTPDDAEGAIQEFMVLGTDDAESVLSLTIDGSFLYAGKLEGVIELWDLDTKQKLRVLKDHPGNVMALQMGWGCLWSASTTGSACKHSTAHYGKYATGNVSQRYQCLSRWKAHSAKILASAITTFEEENMYVTGANDNTVSVWRVPRETTTEDEEAKKTNFLSTLADFLSYRTVSSKPDHAEDCRRGATYLGSLFKKLGGQVEMLGSDDTHNPVVLATFSGKKEPAADRKRILFYGHYDVVPADAKKGKWQTDPFQMKGINGYLYGRGVSDNKGPIIAALYAVTDLMEAKSLENDVVFLIEGMEESGSRGFRETVWKNKDIIGRVDYILLANSYWLDDEVPCLTYGLRGVLHATVTIESNLPDKHSGVDGSYMVYEPLSDLTSVLSRLKGPGNRITVPGFYDAILPPTPDEDARYDNIARVLTARKPQSQSQADLKQSLMARWREPNLTIHRYKVSGPEGSLVSSHASAAISLRLVPGQEVDDVFDSLRKFVEDEFKALGSGNMLEITVNNKAEPWLGDPSNEIFRTLERAVMEAWAESFDTSPDTNASSSDHSKDAGSNTDAGLGSLQVSEEPDAAASPSSPNPKSKKPLYIREGGSIPAIRFLEKEFGAPAAHLPCGQSTDSAHLDNERLRVLNLMKSRKIFASVFSRL